jgi:fumarylacetoacetase
MASWISIPDDCDFSLQNLPYGVFSTQGSEPRIGTAIGEYALDLKALAKDGVFSSINFDSSTLESQTLNAYAGLDKQVHREVRKFLQELFSSDTKSGHILRDDKMRRDRVLSPLSAIKMHLPMVIGDYTDFFVGLHHAQNVSNTRYKTEFAR